MTLLGRTAELAEEYLSTLGERDVAPAVEYGEMLSLLDGPMPAAGAEPEVVVEELAAAIGPATTASAGPRYFGFVTGGSLPAALAADWLTSTWDQNAFSRATSSAAAAVERVAARWVLEALDLPTGAAVGFVTGATAANLVGVCAARRRLLADAGWDVDAEGLSGAPAIRVLAGEEVHPSLVLALRLAGLGSARIERVRTDDQGAMRADALAELAGGGEGPILVCAQLGNVNSGACDPVGEIVAAVDERAWVHVDAAFGLWARAAPGRRNLATGTERADSWAVDAHKWLNVPYDCAMAIVADPRPVHETFSVSASYLPHAGDHEPGDLVPEMSRRARAVPVYAALRALGRDGLAELVERCCGLAARAAEALDGVEGAEVLNEVVLNQVLVGCEGAEEVAAEIRASGEAWVGATVWRGREAVRVSVSNWSTGEVEIDRLVAAFRQALRRS